MRLATPPPLPPSARSSPSDTTRLRLAVLDVVFGQAWYGVGASPLVAAVLCGALWSSVDHPRLLLWLGALLVGMLLRYAAVVGFMRRRRALSVVAWGWVFAATVTVASLIWGLGAMLLLPAGSVFQHAVVYMFPVGMGAGSALIYSAHQAAALMAFYSILAPYTVALLLQPEPTLRFMAVAGVVLLLLGTSSIRRLGGFIRRSFELSFELEEARKAAELRARTDDLTGLYSRGAFYELGEHLAAQATRLGHDLSLLLIDVDDFKRINDNYGHAAGDAVLRHLASTMLDSFRQIDVVGRLGGDEFGVLLPEAPVSAALAAGERFRARLSGSPTPVERLEGSVTCSVGVAGHVADESLDELIHRADDALYGSKQGGRDRITALPGTTK